MFLKNLQLNTLRDSVESMTERMRGIDEMLALEVKRLQEQNSALESVAFALASERDNAIKEVTFSQKFFF